MSEAHSVTPLAVRWAGDRSLLLEFAALEQAMSAHRALIDAPLQGQLDVIAGARTVLIRLAGHLHAQRARAALESATFAPHSAASAREVTIDVVYDGPDLTDAAGFLGMSPEALIAWHSGQAWMGAFPGFAGFTYCVSSGDAFEMPRRTSPRTLVPGGSVALAGEFSGVYPRDAPGGWQLIGRTNAVMWSLERPHPALIQPWDRVVYRPVPAAAIEVAVPSPDTNGATSAPTPKTAEASPGATLGTPTLSVVQPGMQTLIEDLGREGSAHLGAGLAGVMDRTAMRDANHAVGNRTDAAVLEVLFGGFKARALRPCIIAVAGAQIDVTVRPESGPARRESLNTPFALIEGDTLELGAPMRGARSVVALRGGIEAPASLGSVSTDTLVKLGPPPVAAGDIISTGGATAGAVNTSSHQAPATTEAQTMLRVVFGPRDFWFSADEQRRFLDQRWIVSPDSNRIGIRFTVDTDNPDARPLERAKTGELLSEGMALGSLQVPPSGTPVLLANDQGITGGYPIIAVVLAEDLPLAAQLAPGDAVRFTAVEPASLAPLQFET